MPEASRGQDTPAELNAVGPDYFRYYCELAELLSQEEDSEFTKERLKTLLRQSVLALTPEVDEMLDSVISMRQLQSAMSNTKSSVTSLEANCEDDTGERSQKKRKRMSSSSSVDNPVPASPVSCDLTGEGSGDECKGVALPGTCLSKQGTDPDGLKVNGDLQILLEYGGSKVEEKMKKHSDELLATLGYMEQKLEKLLDVVMSALRPMTLAEKHQLRRLIRELPPKNLNRVAEIVCRRKLPEANSSGEIPIELDNQDDITLWRLYYYVETVEKARELVV